MPNLEEAQACDKVYVLKSVIWFATVKQFFEASQVPPPMSLQGVKIIDLHDDSVICIVNPQLESEIASSFFHCEKI